MSQSIQDALGEIEVPAALTAETETDSDETDPADDDPGVDALKQHLSRISWAGRKAKEIRREYEGRLVRSDVDTARKLRKQAFARMADITEQVAEDLEAVSKARDALKGLPDIRPEEPVIVVAGYPNVGKSSFVNAVTRASNAEASYPFTTTQIHVGHVERNHIRYQLVDTPGLLDRPREERNDSESQAVSALEHAADAVLVLLDPTGECGYPLAVQRALRDDIEGRFEVPVVTVYNKMDRFEGDRAELDDGEQFMSVVEGDNVDSVLDAMIDAVDYEPELPIDENR